jgi:hypothetical protein
MQHVESTNRPTAKPSTKNDHRSSLQAASLQVAFSNEAPILTILNMFDSLDAMERKILSTFPKLDTTP